MARTIVLATPIREYAVRLAEYLRETEPGWEISAFTHEQALRLRLQDAARIDALIGHPEWLRKAEALMKGVGRVAAWSEEPGETGGAWPELNVYQPLPGVAAEIRGLLADSVSGARGNCRLLTVFSASGGAGKTSAALNLVRLAGERGWRTLYLNLETINATFRLFGRGEPDSLSRLLYALQAEPDRFAERLAQTVRHHSFLRADLVDAPDHPGERSAMTPELLESLTAAIRESGRYDLVVADPDSGASPWHAKLIALSDRVVWLVSDDWQCRTRTDRLAGFWQEEWPDWAGKISMVRNRAQSVSSNHLRLPLPPAAALPYVPQWKAMVDPARLFGSAPFTGVLAALLDDWGWGPVTKGASADGDRGSPWH